MSKNDAYLTQDEIPFGSLWMSANQDVTKAKGALLAPFPPPFRDKRAGEEAGMREGVNNFVDNLLRK